MSKSAASSPSLTEELKDYRDQFQNIQEDATELTAALSDEQFNWRPSPKQWSISECLAHLNVVDGMDLDTLRNAVEQGQKAGIFGKGPFRYGIVSRWFVRFMDAPPKFKVSAPKIYTPPSNRARDQVIADFTAIHDQLLDLISKANGLDLARIKVPSPLGRFKFSLGQRIALIAAHDRRHLWQAWEVRRHLNFPQ